MTNQNIISKYDILFSSSKEFAHRVNLYRREDVEGASDNEIDAFCKHHNIKYPPVLWSYTRYFGKKAIIRGSNNIIGPLSMPDVDYALHQAGLRYEWNGMLNLKELIDKKNFMVNFDYDVPSDNDGIYTPEIKSLMNIDDILIFHYEPFRRSFKFIDSSKENSEIFYLTRYYTLTSLFQSFTNRFRDILFMYIASSAGDDFTELGIIDGKLVPVGEPPVIDYSNDFEFVKKYQELFKNKNTNRGKVKVLRDQFYILNDKVEKEENRILSFNEFEKKFLDFLEEKL